MGGLLDGIAGLQKNIGKFQFEHGINTKLSQGYVKNKQDELTNMLAGIVKPMLKQVQDDQRGGIDVNKNYDFMGDVLPPKQKTDYFTGESKPTTAELFGDEKKPVEQAPLMSYRAPLSQQDLFRKHAAVLSLAGFKPEAMQMGMLSPDENYAGARIRQKLAPSAKETMDYNLDVNKLTSKNLLDLLGAGDTNYRTAIEYGGNNDLTENLNRAIGSLGLDGVLNYQSYPNRKGTKVAVAESQITANNARANSSNSTAWRNYNKPFYNPNPRGTGTGVNGKLGKPEQWALDYETKGYLSKDNAIISALYGKDDLTPSQQIQLQTALGRRENYWKISSGGKYKGEPQQAGQQSGQNLFPQYKASPLLDPTIGIGRPTGVTQEGEHDLSPDQAYVLTAEAIKRSYPDATDEQIQGYLDGIYGG